MERSALQCVEYIGDGAYVGHDGFQIWIFTSDGFADYNFIALEPDVVNVLFNYKNLKFNSQPEVTS